jgi:hypothetical protein
METKGHDNNRDKPFLDLDFLTYIERERERRKQK